MSREKAINGAKHHLEFLVKDTARLAALTATVTPQELEKEVGSSSGIQGAKETHLLSVDAQKRLAQTVEALFFADDKISDRAEMDEFRRTFIGELVRRCFEAHEKITPKLIGEMADVAQAATVGTLANRRYFFPVHTVYANSIGDYDVGLVTFSPVSTFFKTHQKAWMQSKAEHLRFYIDAFANAGKQMEGEKWPDSFSEAEEYLRSYRWIASVSIQGADIRTGRKHAHDLVELSCCLLRLFVPHKDGSFIGVATDTLTRLDERFVSIDEMKDAFAIGSSQRLVDMPATEAFFQGLKTRHPAWLIIDGIIAKIAGWQEISPAEQRTIAALRWFGEAWRERHAPTRLVKFSICLEGLLSTGAKQDLTETLAERLSVLCYSELKEIRECYEETREVYTARSKTVHGDPKATVEAEDMAGRAETLARMAILSFASLVPDFLTTRSAFDATLKTFFLTMKLGTFDEALRELRVPPAAKPDSAAESQSKGN